MYGAFDVVLYFVNPTVLVANKLTSYLSYLIYTSARRLKCVQFNHVRSSE